MAEPMSNVPEEMREQWNEFVFRVECRLRRGAEEYGDASLKAPPAALAREVEEELLDVMGWGFMLWLRMRAIAERVKT